VTFKPHTIEMWRSDAGGLVSVCAACYKEQVVNRELKRQGGLPRESEAALGYEGLWAKILLEPADHIDSCLVPLMRAAGMETEED